MARNFNELLAAKAAQGKFVCGGLDSELSKIPESLRVLSDNNKEDVIFVFNRRIVEATHDVVNAYKPNLAFYLAHGSAGMRALERSIKDIHRIAPDVPVILDCKDADIGNTNAGYVKMVFEQCQADAMTTNPYLGGKAVEPFLNCKDKGIIVICRTSNEGAGEFQDRQTNISLAEAHDFQKVGVEPEWNGMLGSVALYKLVAYQVSKDWNANGNCSLVVGATCPEELAEVRKIVGDMPILIPGIGAQGGDIEATVSAGKNSRNQGMIINLSRSAIFASKGPDFAEAARTEIVRVQNLVTQYLNQ
ncbi:MAG: orotidine-5'-phosphate decarboxylase [Minisyncoccia bacterium]